jgi:hypothetical protein
MSASILADKKTVPDEAALAHKLGNASIFLDQIIGHITREFPPLTTEWKHYGQKSGWVMKFYSGKRNLLFLVPCEDYFRLAFTFGEKAVEQILSGPFPDTIKTELSDATKYAEGRTIQIEIRTGSDLETAVKLIRIKAEN